MAFITCTWCGEAFDAPVRPGPSPRYCRPSHRQRAYEARRKAAATGESSSAGGGAPEPVAEGLLIKVLGPVQAFDVNGRPVSLGPTLRGLLAVLALRPRQVVARETVIDHVWPGVEDRVAGRRLHTALWKLRNLLSAGDEVEGRHLIDWSAPGYVLNVSDDQLDWARFRRLRLAGERALRRGDPRLAKSYLSAALSLWGGREVLAGVDVPVDDLGFVAERMAGWERATRNLIDARFRSGEQVIPELEGVLASNPMDEDAVWQLAVAYYRGGEIARTLEVCTQYLRLAAEAGGERPSRVAELKRAVLSGGPGRDDLAPYEFGDEPSPRAGPEHSVYLSAMLELAPTITGPLPAELYLVVEGFGGHIHETSDYSLDASFLEAGPALNAAIALQERLGKPVARIGLDIRHDRRAIGGVSGPPRARARLLASAACEGHILVNGGEALDPGSIPSGSRLRSAGSHRLNAIGPAVEVRQLVYPGIAPAMREPHWFDRDPVHNLAPEPSRFIGREREVATICDALTGRRLVTLTGPPGSGKTRLAARVAGSLTGDYEDGAWFVALQALPHDGLVPGTLAEALRMPRPPVHLGALTRYLRGKHALLIVDNCEHVLAECREVIDAIVTGCPHVSVIATSREALHSEYEQVISVPPLERPPLGPRQGILHNDAVRLFLDRMTESSIDRLTDDTVEAVARICRSVEGIPLALVLAAGRATEIGALSLAEALEEALGEGAGIEILSGGATPEQDRATLAGTMEWSYRLLAVQEQILFDRLSVFRSRFSIDDVAAVCSARTLMGPDIVAALDRLAQTSLLITEPQLADGRSYRLLQPVRDFASARLKSRRRVASAVGRRHAEHFLKIAEEAEPRIRGPQDRSALQRLDATLPDMYAALRWTLSNREADMAVRLVGALWTYWLVRGRGAEAIPLAEAALALDRSVSSRRAVALVACCQLSWVSGEFARIRENSREVLAIGEALFDDRAWALGGLGLVAMDMFDNSDEFIPLRSQEILPLFRRLGDHWYGGQALQTAAGASWHRGDYAMAETFYWESVVGFRKIGHPTQMNSLRGHALMLALLGRLDQATIELENALVAAYTEGDIVGVAEALAFRGAIARYGGDHRTARTYYRDALQTACDAGYGWMILWALNGLGDLEDLGPHVPEGRVCSAVQILSFVEVMSRDTRITLAPREWEDHARDLDRARARLADDVLEAALARGRELTVDEAVELGLHLDNAPVDTSI